MFELEITLEKYRKSLKRSDFLLDFLILTSKWILVKASQLSNFFCFRSLLQLFDGLAFKKSSKVGKSYPKMSVKMIWFLENIIFLPSLALAMNTIISTTSMRMLTKVRFLSWVSCSLANWTQEELALFLLLVQEIRAIGTGPVQDKNPL